MFIWNIREFYITLKNEGILKSTNLCEQTAKKYTKAMQFSGNYINFFIFAFSYFDLYFDSNHVTASIRYTFRYWHQNSKEMLSPPISYKLNVSFQFSLSLGPNFTSVASETRDFLIFRTRRDETSIFRVRISLITHVHSLLYITTKIICTSADKLTIYTEYLKIPLKMQWKNF